MSSALHARSTATDLCLFFSNPTPTSEIYTLSLHDALPIFERGGQPFMIDYIRHPLIEKDGALTLEDRKSTRLNSSHLGISYAVFCLKKKKKKNIKTTVNSLDKL